MNASAPTTAPTATPGAPGRLQRLRAAPRRSGEASFFYFDAHFGCEAVRVLPGEQFVADEELVVTTTLGSCIAACLWDAQQRVGGMNHFLLPDGGSAPGDAGRYGGWAMELLINELLKRGARRSALQAKVFGGGAVVTAMSATNVGERNTAFVIDYLKTERIQIIARDVLDTCARKVCFWPTTGRAMVKRLAIESAGAEIVQQESRAAAALPERAGGSVDLF